jgi:hypothetical protein
MSSQFTALFLRRGVTTRAEGLGNDCVGKGVRQAGESGDPMNLIGKNSVVGKHGIGE